MGAQNSKAQISVPPPASFFPTHQEDEELSETIEKISECHLQAVKIASWITTAICPAYAGTFAFSAATFLLTFIFHRLSSKQGPTTSSPIPKSKGLSRKLSYNGNNKTLESALIDSKVSSAIAKKSVCELRAKTHVIKNRLHRLQAQEISENERRLEVVPAIQACEEVLQLFFDPEHVLRMNPLASVQVLIAFSGVFLGVAELSTALIPSYTEELAREMKLMINVLNLYKDACIEARLKTIRMKFEHPNSMLDVVAGSMAMTSYRLEDSFASFKSFDDDGPDAEPPRIYNDPVEAMKMYKEEVEANFTSMFRPLLKTLEKYKGFQVNNNNVNVDDPGAGAATTPSPPADLNKRLHANGEDDDYEDVDLDRDSDDSDTGTVVLNENFNFLNDFF